MGMADSVRLMIPSSGEEHMAKLPKPIKPNRQSTTGQVVAIPDAEAGATH